MQIIDIEKRYYPVFVTTYNPQVIDVKTLNDARREIKKIGSDPKSIEIMAPKGVFRVVKLENVVLRDAIIIKQDMLSIGGEVAVPRDTFELQDENADILIMGTIQQLNTLVEKLNRHHSRLKDISKELSLLLKEEK